MCSDAHPDRCRDWRRAGDHPSTVALADVRKAIEMFRQVNVESARRGREHEHVCLPALRQGGGHFGHGEGSKTAIASAFRFWAKLEIDPRIRIGGDTGKPVAAFGEDGGGREESI